jgi:para-nitrobenzyl esterase
MAYHSADIAYVFQTRWAAANPAVFDARQRALSDRIQAYWSTFAKTGRPDVGGVDPWPLDTGAGPLVLSPKVTGLRADFAAAHHCAFWNAIGY